MKKFFAILSCLACVASNQTYKANSVENTKPVLPCDLSVHISKNGHERWKYFDKDINFTSNRNPLGGGYDKEGELRISLDFYYQNTEYSLSEQEYRHIDLFQLNGETQYFLGDSPYKRNVDLEKKVISLGDGVYAIENIKTKTIYFYKLQKGTIQSLGKLELDKQYYYVDAIWIAKSWIEIILEGPGYKANYLYNITTGQSFDFYAGHYFDINNDRLIDGRVIFSLATGKVIADVSRFFNYSNTDKIVTYSQIFGDGDYYYIISPSPLSHDFRTTKITIDGEYVSSCNIVLPKEVISIMTTCHILKFNGDYATCEYNGRGRYNYCLFDPDTGEVLYRLDEEDWYGIKNFDLEGNRLFVWSDEGLMLFDTNTRKIIKSASCPDKKKFFSFVYDNNIWAVIPDINNPEKAILEEFGPKMDVTWSTQITKCENYNFYDKNKMLIGTLPKDGQISFSYFDMEKLEQGQENVASLEFHPKKTFMYGNMSYFLGDKTFVCLNSMTGHELWRYDNDFSKDYKDSLEIYACGKSVFIAKRSGNIEVAWLDAVSGRMVQKIAYKGEAYIEPGSEYLILRNEKKIHVVENYGVRYNMDGTFIELEDEFLTFAKYDVNNKYWLYKRNLKTREDTKIQYFEKEFSRIYSYGDVVITDTGIFSPDGKYLQRYFGPFEKKTSNIFSLKDTSPKKLGDGVYCQILPCSTFSIKRTGSSSFLISNTSDKTFSGKGYLTGWGKNGSPPLLAAANGNQIDISLEPGESKEFSFPEPQPETAILYEDQKEGDDCFALIIESNGLLDIEKSTLSEYDGIPRPLFDGTPVALDQQKAIVVTVWGR